MIEKEMSIARYS